MTMNTIAITSYKSIVKRCLYNKLLLLCHLHSHSKRINVKQGGLIEIKAESVDRCVISITAKWQDHIDILKGSTNLIESTNEDSNSCSLTITENDCNIDLQVPEICNIA